ncbi:TonB-dependent receptor [Chromobacterium sp. IIBBL 290-4]|uniref:TonB-dependent receptor n=1 Tax=Chromobacterium sp. IIBBL 290-4 TaxID=2953890 RepID=UPI0020B6ACBB|nr:TonB-dependent receptor [Chromobacterium sp. IIBBL 290-4]UTH76178.1 TonB-dependent receptor [Chromobacterium sp. IIBBL 290-4]
MPSFAAVVLFALNVALIVECALMFKLQPCAALVALACSGLALADAGPLLAGDPVIVTASRVPQKISSLPANVTVISAEDIANSAATTVQDVLSNYAGVHVLNSSGSASSAMVDLRGFGMTGLSNTLILVDGVRQNTNDLAAPNLGSVTLANIDHIEVVRGMGGVAYGGGATGGVINIITKSGAGSGLSGSVTLTGGSYDLRQLDANLHAANQYVALDAYVQSLKTDNYRQNNAERDDNAGLSLTFKHADGSVKLFANSANQGLRLPGYLTANSLQGRDPLATNPTGTYTPDDFSSTDKTSGGISIKQDLGKGVLYADFARRNKDALSNYSGYVVQSSLTEDASAVRYVLPIGQHEVTTGADWLNSTMDVLNTSHAQQKHAGFFLDSQWKVWQGATLSVGGRQQLVDDKVNAASGGANLSTIETHLHAWSLGLKQVLGGGWSAYARAGQSFRIGTADEVTYTNGQPLVPQQSHDKEVGVEWSGDTAKLKTALFRNDLTNEIVYLPFVIGPSGYPGVNINLPQTRHQGVELESSIKLSPAVSLNGNLTWTQATFQGGFGLTGKTLPMVPKLMANLGLAWQINDANKLAVNAQYVSEQVYDNDQQNVFPSKLPAYTVLNAKYSYRFDKSLSASASVNNMLGKRYASYGSASAASGNISLYPANGRNCQFALTYAF